MRFNRAHREAGPERAPPCRGSIDYLGSESRSFRINGLELVSLTFVSWTHLDVWLRQVDGLRQVA